TTSTSGGGYYNFTVAPGNYTIQFVKPSSSYIFSQQDVGSNDAIDSDGHIVTGTTAAFTVVSGQIDKTRDAGLYQSASIGDFVWEDIDGDGLQETGEPGLPGITVTLLDSSGTT